MSTSTIDRAELEPQQERSRATRRRILTAANLLLRERSFESLSVQEIARAAGCSIGAFYGRFRGKDELLAPLFDRHNRGLERWLGLVIAGSTWRAMPLETRLGWMARMDVRILRSRRWLIRALAVYVRRDGAGLTAVQLRRRSQFSERVRELMLDCADQVAHADKRSGIDFAIFMIATLCRERVLFGELSKQAWTVEGDEALVSEVSRAAFAYLTGGVGPGKRAPGA